MFPNIQAEDGVLPSIRGVSWFGVEVMARLPLPSTYNQAQPEPKRVAAALEKRL